MSGLALAWRLARRELHRVGPGNALGVTTLLHEAYLSISRREGTVFADHGRFMAYAGRVMRGLIIDEVRRRRSEKRGGLFHITSFRTDHADRVTTPEELIRIGAQRDVWLLRNPGTLQGYESYPPEEAVPDEAWMVFDSAGHWLGDVAMPEGFELHDVTAQGILGVHTDSLGVETIRLHRLVRP